MYASSIETPIQKIKKEKIMIMSLSWLTYPREEFLEYSSRINDAQWTKYY